MKKRVIGAILAIVIILVIGLDFYYNNAHTNITPSATPTSTPTPTPEPKPFTIDVKVTPWGDMYRRQPDVKTDFSVELVSLNQNTTSPNSVNIVFNAGALFWIVEKAYYTSDLFTGERWINITKSQYTLDLQKTFTFNLTNVPEGSHYLTLAVIFHEGTRNNATALFGI